MAQTQTNVETEPAPQPSKLKQAGTGGLHALLTLLKYIIYGWAARITLGLWIVAAAIPGILASEATTPVVGVLVGILAFIGLGLAYGAYATR